METTLRCWTARDSQKPRKLRSSQPKSLNMEKARSVDMNCCASPLTVDPKFWHPGVVLTIFPRGSTAGKYTPSRVEAARAGEAQQIRREQRGAGAATSSP